MPANTPHPLYSERLEDWQACRLFYEGEQKVKAQSTIFIPKPEECTDKEYENYVRRAFFFPAIERTISGLSGAIDRKEPTVSVPPRIEYIVDNADSEDSSLRQFSKIVLDEIFIAGRCGILVDRDETGGQPYLSMYRAEDILNWYYDKNLGLIFVVLQEKFFEYTPDDPFVQEEQLRYRVLKLDNGKYVQELWAKDKNDKIYQIGTLEPTKQGVSLDYIPFVFCNVRSITPKIDKPPLLDMVRKNAEHLRVSADYANSLYFTGNPVLWVSGVKAPPTQVTQGKRDENEPPFKIPIGSSRAIRLPVDAKIGMLECSGHGVKPNQERANDIKLEMAVLGARLLEQQRAGVESAETAQIRQSGESAALSNIVVNVSAAIRKSLQMMDEWEGGNGDNVDFQLNNDFVDITINPQLLTALSQLVDKEQISWDTFYYNLAIGEISVPGRTPDEERKLIETQPKLGSAQQAMDALKALQAGQGNPPIGGQPQQNQPSQDATSKNQQVQSGKQ